MFLTELLDNLFDRFPSNAKTDELTKKYTRKLNLSYKDVYRAYHWEFRKRSSQLLVTPNYTAGTCSFTKYDGTNWATASTVSLSSALTVDMAGRYFQPFASGNWYRIVYGISGSSQLILENPIVEDSASNVTFKIWKRFHTLNSDVGTILDVGKWNFGGLENRRYAESEDSRLVHGVEFDLADPSEFSAYGKDDYASSYTIGTVTIAIDTNIAVGVGTQWLGNVTPGDLFIVGKNKYRVKTVQSDTRIVLRNYVTPAVSASTYEIQKDMAITLKIFTGSAEYLTLPYDYLSRPYDMVHAAKDRPDMPEDFDEVIIDFAMYMIMEDKDDVKYLNHASLAQSKLQSLKSKFRTVYPKSLQFSPTIHSGMPGR